MLLLTLYCLLLSEISSRRRLKWPYKNYYYNTNIFIKLQIYIMCCLFSVLFSIAANAAAIAAAAAADHINDIWTIYFYWQTSNWKSSDFELWKSNAFHLCPRNICFDYFRLVGYTIWNWGSTRIVQVLRLLSVVSLFFVLFSSNTIAKGSTHAMVFLNFLCAI